MISKDKLLDILQSQFVVFGDRQLTTRPKLKIWQTLDLFMGDIPVIRCLPEPYMSNDKQTLSDVIKLVESAPDNCDLHAYSFDLKGVRRNFEIGFMSEDEGFVQIVERSELRVVKDSSVA